MRVDLDAEGVAAESLPRFQQAPRQLRQLWRWAAASVALAAACAVLGFFIGLFAADSLWPPLLYNLGAAWLVLFAGLHAAYRVAAWRCVVLGAEASARPAWLRWQRGEPDAAADSAYERLLERLGQAIAHGLAQLGHAALWLAASAALALCLVAAGWRLDLPPASSGQAADLAIGICLLLAFAVLVLERRFASQGPAHSGRSWPSGQLARGADPVPWCWPPSVCSWLARATPLSPAPGGTARPVAAALALELLAGRSWRVAPQRAASNRAWSPPASCWPTCCAGRRVLQRLRHELHQLASTCARSEPSVSCGGRSLRCCLMVSLSGWLLSGVREIGMDAEASKTLQQAGRSARPGLHLGGCLAAGAGVVMENGVVHGWPPASPPATAEPSRSRPPKVRPRIAPTACGTPPTSARNRRSSPAWPTTGKELPDRPAAPDVRIVYRIALDDAAALAATCRSAGVPTLVRSTASRVLVHAFASRTLGEVLRRERERGRADQPGSRAGPIDRLGSGVGTGRGGVGAIHPPAGAANAYHAVQAAQITAQALIAREREQAAAQLASATTGQRGARPGQRAGHET